MAALIRMLLAGLLLYVGYRVLKAMFAPGQGEGGGDDARLDGEEAVQDPVCGVYLTRADAVVGTLDGQRHYFCSMDCLEKFREKLDHNGSLERS